MTTQAESKLSRQIMETIRRKGYWCMKIHGSAYQMTGVPDILVCAKGRFIGLETKMPNERNETSARQDLVMGEIEDAGGKCFVVCSPTEAIQSIRWVLTMT